MLAIFVINVYSGWHDLTIIVFHVEDYSIYESIALPRLLQNQASQLVERKSIEEFACIFLVYQEFAERS